MSKYCVVMTTYNRIDLLERTIGSLLRGGLPDEMFVFDDCSEAFEKIKSAIGDTGCSKLVQNKERLGVDANTPHALETVFTSTDYDYVVVLDSDVEVSAGWDIEAADIIDLMESDKSVAAIQLMNLDSIKNKTENTKHPQLLNCNTLTACGLIVSRGYWMRFILPQKSKGYSRWDMKAAEEAKASGLSVCCFKHGVIQHIGDKDGSHAGPTQVSSFFKTQVSKIEPGNESLSSVLIFPGNGFRNLAVSMVVANLLVDNGSRVRVFHHDEDWARFIDMIGNGRFRSLHKPNMFQPDSFGSFNMTNSALKSNYPEYTPLITELESDGNRGILFSVENDIEKFIGLKLYAKFGIKQDTVDWSKILIEPNVEKMQDTVLVNNSEKDIDVVSGVVFTGSSRKLTLSSERPNISNAEIRRGHIIANKPNDVVSAIYSCGKFVSALNHSSWASLFCDCERLLVDTLDWTNIPFPKSVVSNSSAKSSRVISKSSMAVADIIIPTCKNVAEISPLLCDLEGLSYPNRVYATCTPASASRNRNIGLNWARTPIVIMVDDDMRRFYEGWVQDITAPFIDEDVVMVSARLLRPDGSPGTMVGSNYDLSSEVVEVAARELPTAAIAFRDLGVRFDEGFIGSGFEDNWFCKCLGNKAPNGKFVISNKCKLVHLNEMKNQHGPNWEHNEKHYKGLCERGVYA